MAAKKKYPKRPKTKSGLTVWENYHAKCKEVDRHNSQLEKDKKKKAQLIAKKPGSRK